MCAGPSSIATDANAAFYCFTLCVVCCGVKISLRNIFSSFRRLAFAFDGFLLSNFPRWQCAARQFCVLQFFCTKIELIQQIIIIGKRLGGRGEWGSAHRDRWPEPLQWCVCIAHYNGFVSFLFAGDLLAVHCAACNWKPVPMTNGKWLFYCFRDKWFAVGSFLPIADTINVRS